jgi:hypothetical protein
VIKQSMRRLTIMAVVILAAGLVLAASGQTATSDKFVHGGNAYGVKVQVGGLLVVTPQVSADIGSCFANTTNGSHKTALSLNIPNILSSDTVDSRVETGKSSDGTSTFTRSTETIQNVNLLGGLIHATVLKALSEVRYTDGSGFSFRNGSSVVGLTINGQSITVLTPNTKIDLPGIGFVVVNEQKQVLKPDFASQEVNLIHVHVTNAGNPLGLQLGTDITVAHAFASLTTPLPIGGRVNGSASGIYYQLGNVVKIGQNPHASIPCLGGTSTANLASLSVPNILSAQTLSTTATGTLGLTKTVGETTATIQSANLLNGLVTATAIKAVAHGEYDGANYTFNSNGSTLALSVAGVPVLNIQPNMTIQIAHVGTLHVYHVINGPKSITVRMIELVISTNNNLGLPGGTTLRVGNANVSFP